MQLIDFKSSAIAHHIFYKILYMSCASAQVLPSADCSTVEIPADEFWHFMMDCCLLEVRATLSGVGAGEAYMLFHGSFVCYLRAIL